MTRESASFEESEWQINNSEGWDDLFVQFMRSKNIMHMKHGPDPEQITFMHYVEIRLAINVVKADMM